MSKQSKQYESMRQTQANTFSDGLNMDLHPLTTPNTILTDCVNGTMITYNDNEFVLQNDRGNKGVGNEAVLPNGQIPIAMKEYNGVIYIVSRDINGNTEIGTYPSPKQINSVEITTTPNITDLLEKLSNKLLFTSELQYPLEFYWTDEDKKISSPDKYKLFVPELSNIVKLEHYTLDNNGNKEKIILQESESDEVYIFPNKFDALLGYKFEALDITTFNIEDQQLNTLGTSKSNTSCVFKIQSSDKNLLHLIKNGIGEIKCYTKYYLESVDKTAKMDLIDFLNKLKFINNKLENPINNDLTDRDVLKNYWNKIPVKEWEEYGDYFNLYSENLYFKDPIGDFVNFINNKTPFLPQLWLYDGINSSDGASTKIEWDQNNKKLTIGDTTYSSFVIESIPVYESKDSTDNKYLAFDQHIARLTYDVGSIIQEPEWFSQFTYNMNGTDLELNAVLDLNKYFNGREYDLDTINERGLNDSTFQLYKLTNHGILSSIKWIKSDSPAYIVNTNLKKPESQTNRVLTGNIPIEENDSNLIKNGTIIHNKDAKSITIKGTDFTLSNVATILKAKYTEKGTIKIEYQNESGDTYEYEGTSNEIQILDRYINFSSKFNNIKKDEVYLFRIDFPGLGEFNKFSKDYASFIVITTDYFLNLTGVERFDKVLLSQWLDVDKFNISIADELKIYEQIYSSNKSVYDDNRLPLLQYTESDDLKSIVQEYLKHKKDILNYDNVTKNGDLNEEIPYYKCEGVSKIILNSDPGSLNGLYESITTDLKGKTSYGQDINLESYGKPWYNMSLTFTSYLHKIGFISNDSESLGIKKECYKNFKRQYLVDIVDSKNIFNTCKLYCEDVARHHFYQKHEGTSYKLSCKNERIYVPKNINTQLWNINSSKSAKEDCNVLQSGCGWAQVLNPQKYIPINESSSDSNTYPLDFLKNKSNMNFLSMGKITTGKHVGYTGEKNIIWGIGINKNNRIKFPLTFSKTGISDEVLKSNIEWFLNHHFIKIPHEKERIISLKFLGNPDDNYKLEYMNPSSFDIKVDVTLYPKQASFIGKYMQTYNIQNVNNLAIDLAPTISLENSVKNVEYRFDDKYKDFLDLLFNNINHYFWSKDDLYDENTSTENTLYSIENDTSDARKLDDDVLPGEQLQDKNTWVYDPKGKNICIGFDNVENEQWCKFQDINGCNLEKLYWNIKMDYPFDESIDDLGYKSIKFIKMYE